MPRLGTLSRSKLVRRYCTSQWERYWIFKNPVSDTRFRDCQQTKHVDLQIPLHSRLVAELPHPFGTL